VNSSSERGLMRAAVERGRPGGFRTLRRFGVQKLGRGEQVVP